jgi:hypothetical protein
VTRDRSNSSIATSCQSSSVIGVDVAAERHYSVAEVAALWNLSTDAVRRVFCREPGVLTLGNRSGGRKRRYTTLRIPESVLERVHRRLAFE